MGGVIITVIIALVVAVVSFAVGTSLHEQKVRKTIGDANEKAKEITDKAAKAAEDLKREKLLEVKEESIKQKNELEKETKERRSELQRQERRVLQKEEAVDKKSEALERREASCNAKENELNKQREKIARLNEERVQELERISGLTSEQAKEYLLKIVEDDVKHESALMIKEYEARAKEEAERANTAKSVI